MGKLKNPRAKFPTEKVLEKDKLRSVEGEKSTFPMFQDSSKEHIDTRSRNHSAGETGILQLHKQKCKDTHCTSVEEVMSSNKEHCDTKKKPHMKQVADNSDLPQQSIVQQKLNKEHKDSRRPFESQTTDTDKAKKVLEEFVDNATQKSSNSNNHQTTAYGNYVVDPWKSGCMQLGKIEKRKSVLFQKLLTFGRPSTCSHKKLYLEKKIFCIIWLTVFHCRTPRIAAVNDG